MNERLKELRKALHLTQKAFAEKIGAKQNTIATYEMGRNNPSDPVIRSICIAFGVNEEWLRSGTESMFIEKNTFSLDEYSEINDLTSVEKEIVRGFMELSPNTRNAIYTIFKNAISAEHSTYDNVPDTASEFEDKYQTFEKDEIDANEAE